MFQCNVDGNPPLSERMWEHRFNGKIIRSHNVLKHMLVNDGRSLNISLPSDEDVGSYFCYARNGILSKDSTTFWTYDAREMPDIFSKYFHISNHCKCYD